MRNDPLSTFIFSIGNGRDGGYVLLTALVFTAILFAVSAGLITYANQYSNFERHATDDAQALQLAEGGIDNAVYQLNQNPNYSGETLNLPGGTDVIVRYTASALRPPSERRA